MPRILATLPGSWSHSVDYEKNIIHLATPDLQNFIKELNNGEDGFAQDVFSSGSLLFTSRTKKGITFSQEIKVDIPDRFYGHYFLVNNANLDKNAPAIDQTFFNPSKVNEKLDIKDLKSKQYTLEFYLSNTPRSQHRDSVMTKTPEELLALLAQPIQIDFLRYPSVYNKLEQVRPEAYIYDADSLHSYVFHNGDAAQHVLGVKAGKDGKPELLTGPVLDGSLPAQDRPRFVHPIAWMAFRGNTKSFIYHIGPMGYRRPLERVGIRTELELKNPHRYFGLEASETFDASRVTLYTGSSAFLDVEDGFLPKDAPRVVLAKAEKVCRFDKATDMLRGQFVSLPPSQGNRYNASLIIEYTKANGSKIYRILREEEDSDNYEVLWSIPGGWRTFHLDANQSLTKGMADVVVSGTGVAYTAESKRVSFVSEVLDHNKVYFGDDSSED